MQTRQKNYLFSILTFFLGLALTLGISSCKDDNELRISEYDPTVHVYATNFRSRVGEWETYIDITTGNYDSIPGTKEPAGAINFPNGTAALTDFNQNRRIYISQGNGQEMIVQDLTTLEKTTIALELPDGSSLITRPEFLAFGADNNIVYVFDIADDAIYAVDLTSQTFHRLVDNIAVDRNEVVAFFYLKSSHEILFLGNDFYTLYDLSIGQLVAEDDTIPDLFGFVKHPETEDIFALSLPTDEITFRLVRMVKQGQGNQYNIVLVSLEDLAMDDLSPNLQTIHTATNAYVCRGGTTLENNIETYIYSIDLNTGELIRTVTLNGFELMTKLEGE
jgi:DNA-binding beta-propeller fold protein YncE